MVVIFGWGAGEARDLGEVAPLVCPNCHNQVFLHQIHSEKPVSSSGMMRRSATSMPRRRASAITVWRVMPSRKQSAVGV